MNSVFAVGANETLLWGMNARERLRRIARAQTLLMTEIESEAALLVNLDFAFDPSWLRFVAARPDHVLSFGGVPVVAHCSTPARRAAVIAAMQAGKPVEASGLTITAYEQSGDLINDELRKRERPFVDRLVPERVPSLERASYFGAYKGVTDLLTKYLWPEWALLLTRLAARIGATPNMVTALGGTLCVLATIAFYYGWYWSGMLAGLGFMVLDTVDGKLARCTITSSKWGEFFDHGIDLVHPPFWWYAWGVGLAAYGRPLSDDLFWIVMAVIIVGYVAQRLIEGAFIKRFAMHIHVWRPFDSHFRLVTARRNPNMVILFVALVAGRPDLGLIGVAVWTLLSLLVHAVRLVQAGAARSKGPLRSWLS